MRYVIKVIILIKSAFPSNVSFASHANDMRCLRYSDCSLLKTFPALCTNTCEYLYGLFCPSRAWYMSCFCRVLIGVIIV